MNDDFYIGYRKEASPALARFLRVVSALLLFAVVGIAAFVGASQQPADPGQYDFGHAEPRLVGLVHDPMPLGLLGDSKRPVLLVGTGKHGPPTFVTSDPRFQRPASAGFAGTAIERDGIRMLEVGAELIVADATPPSNEVVRLSAGDVTLEGELIDTKCFLGVMKPGRGKVHRGCAALCLRGGVPPGLAVRDAHGATRVIVLNAHAAGAPAIDPELAGRVVRVSGALEYVSGLPILRVREMALR